MEEVETVGQEVGKISKDEVRKVLKRMNNGKAVGPDDIPLCSMEVSRRESSGAFDKSLQQASGH